MVKKTIFKTIRASELLHMTLACVVFIGDFGYVIVYRTHGNGH